MDWEKCGLPIRRSRSGIQRTAGNIHHARVWDVDEPGSFHGRGNGKVTIIHLHNFYSFLQHYYSIINCFRSCNFIHRNTSFKQEKLLTTKRLIGALRRTEKHLMDQNLDVTALNQSLLKVGHELNNLNELLQRKARIEGFTGQKASSN